MLAVLFAAPFAFAHKFQLPYGILGTGTPTQDDPDFDAAMKTITEKQAALKKLVDEKAEKSEIDALKAEIEALKNKAETERYEVLKGDIEKQHAIIVKQGEEITNLKEKGARATTANKSFGDALKEAVEEQNDAVEKFARKERKSLILELKGFDLKTVGDMSTGNVTGGTRYGEIMRPGIIENPKRKVHIDQIISTGSIGPGNSYHFMRQNGEGEGSIAPVAETGTKTQIDYDLVESSVNIETIAGWVRFTRKAMNNIPGFISFLQSRLPETFRNTLDSQILYGDGNTPNLKGILTAGNFTASDASAALPLVEKIITDISTLEDTYERYADGILLRPADYYSFFLNKATGSGEYNLPQNVVFINGTLYILGIPVYASTAINSPDYIVGDWGMGAQLLVQEGIRIEFFEQDADNVTKNKITARIEGNYALPVYGSDYFIKGNSTLSPIS